MRRGTLTRILTRGPRAGRRFDALFDTGGGPCTRGDMKAGGELPFEAMKVPQVKEVLAARDAKRSGLKAALQRRLHGLLVQAAILSRGEL